MTDSIHSSITPVNIEEELKPYQQNEDIKKQIRILEEFIENDGKLLSEIDSLNKKIEEKIHMAGMILLLILMVFIIFNDVTKYF